MTFIIPQFPLKCNVWRSPSVGGTFAYATPDLVVQGNLSPGRRVMTWTTSPTPNLGHLLWNMELLLPKLTDIRAYWPPFGDSSNDVIECPADSARCYEVTVVDDIGKGFANEHRFVLMYQKTEGTTFSDIGYLPWPIPLP